MQGSNLAHLSLEFEPHAQEGELSWAGGSKHPPDVSEAHEGVAGGTQNHQRLAPPMKVGALGTDVLWAVATAK